MSIFSGIDKRNIQISLFVENFESTIENVLFEVIQLGEKLVQNGNMTQGDLDFICEVNRNMVEIFKKAQDFSRLGLRKSLAQICY
jgi:hypothetical protein